MSTNTLEEMVQKTKKEIENLNHQLASESNNEAINSQKLVKVVRGIGSSTTEFSLRNRLDDIGRYGNGIVVTQKRKAELQKKIASKISQLYLFEKRLNDEKGKNSLGINFDFPIELKVFCKQYLEYFAQFLQDLGINATSNLKEEAGKVLFSVTPTDDVEALDKIREALAVYLNLPASPIVYDESFAAMRLHQQIDNLQHSQKMAVREIRSAERELRLAQTVIEHQDKIIVQKDSIIEQQNKVIEKIKSKSIMMDSLENKEELEELYDGLKIGESKFLWEYLGIKLNLVKVIKTAVKNTFGKVDESKSVLGLDEETVKDD